MIPTNFMTFFLVVIKQTPWLLKLIHFVQWPFFCWKLDKNVKNWQKNNENDDQISMGCWKWLYMPFGSQATKMQSDYCDKCVLTLE